MELSMVPYSDQEEAKAQAARYMECLRNHAASMGGHTNDGCGEFMQSPASPLLCAACGCHRNFHRKELPAGGVDVFGHPRKQYYLHHHHYYHQSPHRCQPVVVYDGRFAAAQMVAPMQAVMAQEDSGVAAVRKRFRTRITPEQKERMAEFAERRGWRIGGGRGEDEAELRRFCGEVGITRQVLKVWIHNHKHSFGSSNSRGSDGSGGEAKKEEEESADASAPASPATPATMSP